MRRCLWLLVFALPAPAVEPLARIESEHFAHGPGLSSVAVAPDGSRIATAASGAFHFATPEKREAYESVILIWNAATGKRERELKVPQAPVCDLAISPDGKLLAARHGLGISLFELATGKLQAEVENATIRRLLGFGPDGTLAVASAFPEKLVLLEWATGKERRTWKPMETPSEHLKGRESVFTMQLSPCGRYVAQILDEPPDYGKPPGGVVITPPYFPRAKAVIVCDAASEKPLYRRDFVSGLDRFKFTQDGSRFFSGGKTISVNDTASGKELFQLEADAYEFAVSLDGRWLIVSTGASQVRLWNLETRTLSREILRGRSYMNSRLMALTADGRTAVLATGTALRLFDTATGEERLPRTHEAHAELRYSEDGKLHSTCNEWRRSWDVAKTPKLLASTPRGVWEGICGEQVLTHSPGGEYYAAKKEETLGLHETATGKLLRPLDGGGPYPINGQFSEDGSRLFLWHGGIGEDFHGIRLFNPKSGRKTGQFATPDRVGYWPAFSQDGKQIAWLDSANVVHVHDGVSGEEFRTLRPHSTAPKMIVNDARLLFTPDGEYLIVAAYKSELFRRPDETRDGATHPIRVFNVERGLEVARFPANPKTGLHSLKLACLACSKDGRRLAVAEEESNTIRVLDTTTGAVLAEYAGHRHNVHSLAFAPDGSVLASAGDSGTILLWAVPAKMP